MRAAIIIPLLIFSSLTGKASETVIIAKAEGSITFVVDNNAMPIEKEYYLQDGKKLAKSLFSGVYTSEDGKQIVTTSFDNDRNLLGFKEEAFFQSVLTAYANHLSITLSPDMIWLLISQGFSRYVDAHSEQLRPLIVDHSDKIKLEIESDKELLSDEADWPTIISIFTSEISKYTKNDIAQTITSDFSTTTSPERIASQITLMEIVKSYFEYTVFYVACGIPSITLNGTPEDWNRVLEKTLELEKYGLKQWTRKLKPILEEFIKAAEGQPNERFWGDIVKKKRVSKLKGGLCNPQKPTKLDGWILTLFPDKEGKTRNQISWTSGVPSDILCANFTYRIVDPSRNIVIGEYPMELWAGFVGAEMDIANNMLTPKIGWLVVSGSKKE